LLKEHEAAHDNLAMVFISELHLDHAKSLASFRAMLQGYADAAFIPFAFVLCGSFSAEPHKPAALARYQGEPGALLWDERSSRLSLQMHSRRSASCCSPFLTFWRRLTSSSCLRQPTHSARRCCHDNRCPT
jgi:hypothetical protein